jgi:hypothetical protein
MHKVNKTLQIRFKADWNVQNSWLCAQTIDDRLHAIFEVRAGTVKLVDEAHAWNAVLIGLTPYGFGLWLNAGNAIEASDRAIENAQRTLNFNREVNVAWCINDVDAVVVPEAGRCSRCDRDATLLLLLHPIHGGGAIMNFADFIRLAGVEKDALGGRSFTGVDMRHDTDVAIHIEWMAACHMLYSEVWATEVARM